MKLEIRPDTTEELTFRWKRTDFEADVSKVPPSDAADELDRIRAERGALRPDVIVEESRPVDAVLHPVFEWDDTVAAERFRRTQARGLIRCLVVSRPATETTTRQEIRAFVSVTQPEQKSPEYVPIRVVLKEEFLRDQVIAQALHDMEAFQRKHAAFVEFEVEAVWAGFDRVRQRLRLKQLED